MAKPRPMRRKPRPSGRTLRDCLVPENLGNVVEIIEVTSSGKDVVTRFLVTKGPDGEICGRRMGKEVEK